MKVTITLDIPDRVVKAICENSMERVINNSLNRAVEACMDGDNDNDDAAINFDDWCHLKWPVVTIWNSLRDAIFRLNSNMGAVEYGVSSNVEDPAKWRDRYPVGG